MSITLVIEKIDTDRDGGSYERVSYVSILGFFSLRDIIIDINISSLPKSIPSSTIRYFDLRSLKLLY